MNELLARITPNPRTEEDAEEVADAVLADPSLLPKLAEGLKVPDDILRAKTAHALERIADVRPGVLAGLTSTFIECARTDPVPMVRWHMAIILGQVPVTGPGLDEVITTLEGLLSVDESIFVKSWSIVSLTYIGMREPARKAGILEAVRPYREHKSVIIKAKAERAVEVMEEESGVSPE